VAAAATTTWGERGVACREAMTLLMASREMTHEVCRRGDAAADPETGSDKVLVAVDGGDTAVVVAADDDDDEGSGTTVDGAWDRCILVSGCNGNTGVEVGGGSGGAEWVDEVGGNGRDDDDDDEEIAEETAVDSVDVISLAERGGREADSCATTVTRFDDDSDGDATDATACMVSNTGMGTLTGSTCTVCNTARCGGRTWRGDTLNDGKACRGEGTTFGLWLWLDAETVEVAVEERVDEEE
jgi:hypothetical protein